MRIWYKARNFEIGKNVTIFFIKPNLQKSETMAFTEWGEGFYYLDAPIKSDGPYVGKVFEDGVPILAYVFRRGVCPGIVTKV